MKDQLLLKNFRKQARGTILVHSLIPTKEKSEQKEESKDEKGASQKRKKNRVNYESNQEDDSEHELPRNERRKFEGTIKNNEWLRMFRQKNQMHDGDREKAVSLTKNIQFDYFTYRNNKFFNK